MKKIFLACLISAASLHAMEGDVWDTLASWKIKTQDQKKQRIFDPLNRKNGEISALQKNPVPFFEDKDQNNKGLVSFEASNPREAKIIADFYAHVIGTQPNAYVSQKVNPEFNANENSIVEILTDKQEIWDALFEPLLAFQQDNEYAKLAKQYLGDLSTYCKTAHKEDLALLLSKVQSTQKDKGPIIFERAPSRESFGSHTSSQQNTWREEERFERKNSISTKQEPSKYDYGQERGEPHSRESSERSFQPEERFYQNEENYKKEYLSEQKKVGELESRIKEMEREFREREREMREMREVNERLNKENREAQKYEEKIKTLKDELEKKNKENYNLSLDQGTHKMVEEHRNRLDKELKEAQEKLKEVLSFSASHEKTNKQLKEENERLKREISEKRTSSSNNESEKDNTINELRQQKEELQRITQEQNTRYQEPLAQYQNKINKAQEEYLKKNQEYEKTIEELKLQALNNRETIQILKTQNDTLQKNLKEKELERNRESIREEPNHTNTLRLTISALEDQLNETTGENNRSLMENIYGMLFKAEPESLELFKPLLQKMAVVNQEFYNKKAYDASKNETKFIPTVIMNLRSYLNQTGQKGNKALEALEVLEVKVYQEIEWTDGLKLQAFANKAKLPN